MSVVDPQCRVHGMERMRVAGSSIMPSIVSGNLNAPSHHCFRSLPRYREHIVTGGCRA